jgi:hypothetical protein
MKKQEKNRVTEPEQVSRFLFGQQRRRGHDRTISQFPRPFQHSVSEMVSGTASE